MKIIHVAPFSSHGGMAYVAHLIEARKHEVADAQWVRVDTTPPRLLPRGVRGARVRLAMRLARSVWRAAAPAGPAAEPRIVHVHTGAFHSFFEKSLFVALGRLRGARTILHIHGAEFDRFYASASQLGRAVVSALLRWPDRIVVLSSYWKEVLCEMLPGEGGARLAVLHNGVALPEPAASNPAAPRSAASEAAGFDAAAFVVLFLGCVGARKGCREILDAAERLAGRPEVRLCLLGGDDFEGDLERYQREAAARRLTNVRFCGHTAGAEKDALLRRADLFILPSHGENFPIAVLEAMAYGLPVVATRVGALPEVIGPENGVLIAPGDAEALARAIDDLRARPEVRAQMGRRNAQKVRRLYSAERFAERLRGLYAGLVGRAGYLTG